VAKKVKHKIEWKVSQIWCNYRRQKIVQPVKNLLITTQELLVMMVMMEMTLVVVPPHLLHKEEVMSNLSLPSRSTSSHTAPRMKTAASQHRQEFQ
jgi:hypothetical protein